MDVPVLRRFRVIISILANGAAIERESGARGHVEPASVPRVVLIKIHVGEVGDRPCVHVKTSAQAGSTGPESHTSVVRNRTARHQEDAARARHANATTIPTVVRLVRRYHRIGDDDKCSVNGDASPSPTTGHVGIDRG